MQNTRGDFYILPHLFLFICALFCSITRTYAHMHTYPYAHPVDFAYQRPVRSWNVAQPKTRSFELGFSQLYTRHTVSSFPTIFTRLRLLSYFSFLFFTRADPYNRTGDTRAFTNCTHNSYTCGHQGAQCILECAVFSFKNKC